MDNKQIEKLWKWCGFKFVPTERDDELWEYPNKFRDYVLPPVTLDTLFRWAVPKLVGFYDVSFGKISKEDTYGCVLRLITMTNGELGLKNYTGKSIDPAEALALAILEVIDGH